MGQYYNPVCLEKGEYLYSHNYNTGLKLMDHSWLRWWACGKAKGLSLYNKERLKSLVELHVGKRFQGRVMDQYDREDNTLWGLYNAMTFVASHDSEVKACAAETLLDKAAKMLMVELKH